MEGEDHSEQAPEADSSDEVEQFIVFEIDSEEYAVAIHEVREVLEVPPITPVPDSPPFILGIMNLRGKIVPILDLEKRLNLTRDSQTESQHVLVTDYEDKLVGIKVDQVKEVLRTKKKHIQPAPTMISAKIAPEFLGGVIVLSQNPQASDEENTEDSETESIDLATHQKESRVLLLLELKKIITLEELQNLTEPSDSGAAEHKEGASTS